jgi:hypothetical protein
MRTRLSGKMLLSKSQTARWFSFKGSGRTGAAPPNSRRTPPALSCGVANPSKLVTKYLHP